MTARAPHVCVFTGVLRMQITEMGGGQGLSLAAQTLMLRALQVFLHSGLDPTYLPTRAQT